MRHRVTFIIDAVEKSCLTSTCEDPEFESVICDGMLLLQQLLMVTLPTFADVTGFLIIKNYAEKSK